MLSQAISRNGCNSGTKPRSRLSRTPQVDSYDLIGVGFGPASLSLAIALHEALDAQTPLPRLNQIRYRQPNVLFLEKQSQFKWHEGMLLPGTKMQISFLKDLATLRNPKSDFTFLNYLHQKSRLVQFSNIGTFQPMRLEYQDYLSWCADWFKDVVLYDTEVMKIEIHTEPLNRDELVCQDFRIVTKSVKGDVAPSEYHSKRVVVAVGGEPYFPPAFNISDSCLIHSSQYLHNISSVLPHDSKSYRIAVIGGGQSSAEVFNDLHSRFPNSRTSLIIKSRALKPSDDSPFVNEIFDPCRVDTVFNETPQHRRESIAEDRNTNYAVVQLDLLERIYATLYNQRVKHLHETEWQHNIIANTMIKSTQIQDGKMVLALCRNKDGFLLPNGHTEQCTAMEAFDAVILGTGYRRCMPKRLFNSSVESIMPANEKWIVERDYRVRLNEKLAPGVGIWVQGCNEDTHGLSDSLLSILATRAGELVLSMFGDT